MLNALKGLGELCITRTLYTEQIHIHNLFATFTMKHEEML